MISPYTAGALIIVALIVFGPSRLPEIGKALGKGIKEFKSGVTDESKKAGRYADDECNGTAQRTAQG